MKIYSIYYGISIGRGYEIEANSENEAIEKATALLLKEANESYVDVEIDDISEE